MAGKFPEINIIVAMTEDGLIGKGDALPWKSSIDMKWFVKTTMGFPVIFGRKTAETMPIFPLKNRPCAVISSTILVPDFEGNNGAAPVFPSLSEAFNFYRNFDKIFIAGGASLYKYALSEEPIVDNIYKTVFAKFPMQGIEGDVYLEKETMAKMSEPYFMRKDIYDLVLKEDCDKWYKDCRTPNAELRKPEDTLFPRIRFETWFRAR